MKHETVTHNTSFSPTAVAVVESLGASESKTGRRLFENVLAPAFQRTKFSSWYYSAFDSREFFKALADIASAAAAGHRPVLHLETHGDPSGLELASGEHIPWVKLVDPLIAINQRTQFNLLVFVAACDGRAIQYSLKPTGRAPAWAIIGPDAPVSAAEIRLATEEFYATLMSSESLRAAMNAMNGSESIAEWRFMPQWAETMFCSVFKRYLSVAGSPARIDERVSEIISLVNREVGVNVGSAESTVRSLLCDHAGRFAQYREHFLMLDQYPENRHRFQMTYESCLGTRL